MGYRNPNDSSLNISPDARSKSPNSIGGSRFPADKLNIPFKTVPKIKKLCQFYDNLVKKGGKDQKIGQGKDPSNINTSLMDSQLSLPEITAFLK